MNHKLLLTLFLFALVGTSIGQKGNVFLQNYSPNLEQADNRNNAIVQGGNDVMYFANNRGVMAYDGHRWKLIETPGTAFALAVDSARGRVYVGCKGDYGYIKIEGSGNEIYQSLSNDVEELGRVTNITITSGKVYFYSLSKVICHGIDQNTQYSWSASEHDEFSGLFAYGKNIYVNTLGKGLQLLSNDGMSSFSKEAKFKGVQIIAALSIDPGRTLISTDENKTYIFDGKEFSPYFPKSLDYLKENTVVGGIGLTEDVFALTTISGGCVLINAKDGKTHNIINYQTGLPDDEVLAIGKDRAGGLWIAHEYGISRADFSLPVKNLSAYNGLNGNLLCTSVNKQQLYVGTTVGVFKLAKLSAGEVSTYTRKNSREKKKVGKFFSKLFGGKKDKQSTSEASSESFYALQSVRYGYKQISGINDKCRELLSYKGMVLAATSNGLYSIQSLTATQILKDRYIHFIYQSLHNGNQIYVGTDQGLLTLRYIGSWRVEKTIEGVDDPIFSMTEQGGVYLWLGKENEVTKVNLNADEDQDRITSYDIGSSFSEQIVVRSINGQPIFFSNDGVYTFENKIGEVVRNKKLSSKFSKDAMVFSNDGYTWLYNGLEWTGFSQIAEGKLKQASYLNVIDDILYVHSDDKNSCWVIDRTNGFYQVDAGAKRAEKAGFHLAYRSAMGDDGKLLDIDDLTLTYDHSSIRLAFTSPFYINEKGTRYQYFLDGVMDQWSQWGGNSIVDFPYLPEGNYELHTKAKNVFGEIIEGGVINIIVVPPYYRRWWFYLFEIIFMCTLLFGSILLNTNRESTGLSKTLTFLTFIIIYKMLTVMIKYSFGSSFLFDFIVAVVLAILVHKAEDKIIAFAKSEKAIQMKERLTKRFVKSK